MNITVNEYLSLREIGRRLNIPPSSVVYYKDRFAQHIPHAGGTGRRKKYPAEAITIFKEIRDMFDKNWSTEQIEESLTRGFAKAYKPMRFDEQLDNMSGRAMPASAAMMHELTGALDKISSLLQNQTLFRAEIDSLRQEIVLLKNEKLDLEDRYKQRIVVMETELEKLRFERADIIEQVLERMHRGKGAKIVPPEVFLSLPLVIKSGQDEYLGVAGKTKHFNLKEFLSIIHKNATSGKALSMAWGQEGQNWILTVLTRDHKSNNEHEHIIEVVQTVTPSKNSVVQLTNLTIDGNPVPEPFLLVLFRKIKDGFDD